MKLPKIFLITLMLIGCLAKGFASEYTLTATNIAELRSLNIHSLNLLGLTNITVYVRGYYAPGDRGGGTFQWIPTFNPDDGGRWITNGLSTGCWLRLLNGEQANVKMWGAMGNWQTWADKTGTYAHDDTIAIQNAINSLGWWATSANGLGSDDLLFPAGNYKVTNTIVFWSQLHIHGEGQANNTEITMPLGINKDIFHTTLADDYLKGTLWVGGANGGNTGDNPLNFDNMSISFQGDVPTDESTRNTTNAAIVIFNPFDGCELHDLTFINGGYGIRCFGTGEPGLRARNISAFGQAIAGINMEPFVDSNGSLTGGATSADLSGVGGDYRWNSYSSTACLIRVDRCSPVLNVHNFKAEGQWGGGIVQYSEPTNIVYNNAMGALTIDGGYYNSGTLSSQTNYPRDVVVLVGASRSPAISIHALDLYGVRYLIRDQITGRNLEPDVNIYTGAAQVAAPLPICYQSWFAGAQSFNSIFTIGQTAFSYLYATNSGWYRVMDSRAFGNLSAKLTVSTVHDESTELEINGTGNNTPWVNVTRASLGVANPVITQARAYSYWNGGGYELIVDVYVGHPITGPYVPQEARIVFTMDINGVQVFDTRDILMNGVISPASTVPVGAVVTTVNTYR